MDISMFYCVGGVFYFIVYRLNGLVCVDKMNKMNNLVFLIVCVLIFLL